MCYTPFQLRKLKKNSQLTFSMCKRWIRLETGLRISEQIFSFDFEKVNCERVQIVDGERRRIGGSFNRSIPFTLFSFPVKNKTSIHSIASTTRDWCCIIVRSVNKTSMTCKRKSGFIFVMKIREWHTQKSKRHSDHKRFKLILLTIHP